MSEIFTTTLAPIPISLSSSFANVAGKSKNSLTFTLGDPIRTPLTNCAAVFSVDNFTFFNTFANIKLNENILKIVSTFTDASGTPQTSDEIRVEVPPGHYTGDSLLAYLSVDGVCNKIVGGYYYGLGNSGDTDNYPPFSRDPYQEGKIHFHPPTAGSAGVLGEWSNAGTPSPHQYTSFFLKVDSETFPLMRQMGLLNIAVGDTPNNLTAIPYSTTGEVGVGMTVRHNASTDTGFYFGNYKTDAQSLSLQIGASDLQMLLNMEGPPVLAVAIKQIASGGGGRNSFNQFAQSGTLCYAPVSAPYGSKIVYIPSDPLKVYVTNPSITALGVEIRSTQSGALVDFDGVNWTLNLRVEFVETQTTANLDINNAIPKNHTQRVNRSNQGLPSMEPGGHDVEARHLASKRKLGFS